jgi:hypothetical protein
MDSINKLTSTESRSWCVISRFILFSFSLISLMAYSKGKLKSNGHKSFPFSRHSEWNKRQTNDYLHLILHHISFKGTLIKLTSVIHTPNITRMFYNTFLPTQSWAFFKSVNGWCKVAKYSHCSPVCGARRIFYQYFIDYAEIHTDDPG